MGKKGFNCVQGDAMVKYHVRDTATASLSCMGMQAGNHLRWFIGTTQRGCAWQVPLLAPCVTCAAGVAWYQVLPWIQCINNDLFDAVCRRILKSLPIGSNAKSPAGDMPRNIRVVDTVQTCYRTTTALSGFVRYKNLHFPRR